MATTTPNYGLTKPAGTDPVDISVLNGNADIIDTALHGLDTSKQDAEEGMGLSQESFTTVEKEALALINAAFPFVVQRGEYTLNDQSELTFDTLTDTKYYRYTGSAIGNPVAGGYGIVINIRFTSYAVQLLFSQTTASAPTRLLYRLGKDMSTTPKWMAWQTVSTGSGGGGGGGATIDTLWSDSNGATVGTEYTLAGNINDYDVVVLKVSDPGDLSQFSSYEQYPFVVSMIGADEQLNCLGYGFRYFTVSIHGNTFTVTRAGTSGEGDQYIPKLWQIVGIKY